MEPITFEDVPRVLGKIYQIVAEMQEQHSHPVKPEEDRLMTLPEYQDYMFQKTGRKPARQTIYQSILDRKVPNEKYGKYVYFRRSAIDDWLANGRQMTGGRNVNAYLNKP